MSKTKEYVFSREIENKLKSYKRYLQKQGDTANTINQKTNYAGYYLSWLEKEQLQAETARYNDMLNFIDYCRLEEKSKMLINRKLGSIRHYYKYLYHKKPDIKNPAANLFIRGVQRKVPSNLIDFAELEQLYENYKTVTLRDKRNKTILGLLIYQGLTTDELHRIEPGDLHLKEGKINIPGNLKKNSRKLELKPFQILELLEYLNETRPEILKRVKEKYPLRSGRKPDKLNLKQLETQLFISINGSEDIKGSLIHIFRALRKTKPEIRNAKQIRASVITYWLKNYNLRQVQYMAGHKYVSSTERYQLNNIDDLQKKIEELHPLK